MSFFASLDKRMPEVVLFIDSSKANDLTSDGSTFTYTLQPALQVPNDADPKLRVVEADIVYTTPNVSAAKANNSLKFSTWSGGSYAAGTHVNFNLTNFEIVFDEGLYSLADIRSLIVQFCEASTKLADSALDIRGVSATQKVEVNYDAENNPAGLLIQWSDTNSIGKLLGFSSDDVLDYFTITASDLDQHYTFVSDVTANFDSISHFQLRFSCLSGTNYDPSGSGGGQVAAAVVPDVSPGSTIRHRPYHPLPCEALALRGARTSSFVVRVTDNHGVNAILRESYSARIIVSW